MSIEIIKEKQQFKSTSMIFMLLSIGAIFVLLLKVIYGGHGVAEKDLLEKKAHIVGLQVMQIYIDHRQMTHQAPAQLADSKIRGIASVGESAVEYNFPNEGLIGVDPWGNSFKYRIQEASEPGGRARISIYSKGPPSKLITKTLEEDSLVLELPIPST